ncbi:TonB-dependent receptor [Vibrio coralliilyticus]|uniref:TonB-dependent receptor n=1 Tax=Vibrio coralliilyticus TaxID=190893 RepID=UPI00148E5ECE|nr:TonB-dependent receptor [Vibrio coralliilyticus]NOI30447.1 TonB-dependent receptor [Vibrio coralliilyticus]NOI50035.1 TonB-dependent receptor [Vibrio coralliilyticus]
MLSSSPYRQGNFAINGLMRSLIFVVLGYPTSATAGDDEASYTQLETMVVTARQNEELAKDVPVSMTVLDGETLNERGLKDFEEVLRATPGVMVYSTGDSSQANIVIRGVGALNPVSMDDSSVILNIDGVSMSSRNVSLATLDIDQVEVLKGPQGTLYGRNSAAGAINVTTNKPSEFFESNFKVEAGNQGYYLGEFMLNRPISDMVSARLTVRGSTREHWVDFASSGEPITNIKDIAARASVNWEVDHLNQVYLVAETNQVKDDVALFVLKPYGDSPSVDVSPWRFDDNQKSTSRYALTWASERARYRFESISSFTQTDSDAVKVFGKNVSLAQGNGAIEAPYTEEAKEEVLSQELRLSSKADSSWFWVAGLNYYQSERSFDTDYERFKTRQQRDYKTNSYAAYSEITYPLTDRLSLTGGVRYTADDKKYQGQYADNKGVVTPDTRRIEDDYGTGRLAASYALNQDANVYATYARGYKSGGVSDYPSQVLDSEPYKASTVDSLEVGIKMAPEHASFMLTGSMYLNFVEDDRLLGFDTKTYATTVINADTQTQGIELEGKWSVSRRVMLDVGISYIDAEITSDARGVSGGDVASGNRIPDVAKWNTNMGVSWWHELPSFLGLQAPVLNSNVVWRYVDSRPADAQNSVDLGAYHKVDARFGLELDAAVIYLWGQNLLDEQFDLYAYNASNGVVYGAPSKRRTFGIGLNYSY